MLRHLLGKFVQLVGNWLKRLRGQKESCLNGRNISVKSEIKLSSKAELEKDD